MRKIKKNDDVIVIAGKDKGSRGSVQQVLGEYLLVGGVNKVKKHQKPNPVKGLSGGIVEKELPIHISNVAVITLLPKKAIELDQNSGGRAQGARVQVQWRND